MNPSNNLTLNRSQGRLGFVLKKYFEGDLDSEYSQDHVEPPVSSISLEPSTPSYQSLESQSSLEPQSFDLPDTSPSLDSSSNINSGSTKITSSLFDDEDFKRDRRMAEIVHITMKQCYPHVVNPPEGARIDNRHPWEVINDRYKEFIKFYEQYQHDLKRVSYN